MITVGDLMVRDLVTVREDDDLALADSLFRLGAIRHLPVVRERRLVGLLVPADLLRAGAAAGDAWRASPVAGAMLRGPEAVQPSASLAAAARQMLEHQLDCLPVCAGDGTILGIVTATDFVRLAADVVRDLDRVAEVAATPPGPGSHAR